MKKLVVLLTVVCFTFSFAAIFAGCGKEEPAPVPAKPEVKPADPKPKPVIENPKAPEAPAVVKKKGDEKKSKPKPAGKPASVKKKGGKKKKK